MTSTIRRRFLAVALLGVAMSLVAAFALYRMLSVTAGQRVERGRESVTQEVNVLGGTDPEARLRDTELVGPGGIRAGFVGGKDVPAGLDPAWQKALAEARERAGQTSARATADVDTEAGMVLIAAAPARGGGFAWAGISVPDPPYLQTWKIIIGILALTTLALVATALGAVAGVRSGAEALQRSLAGLAKDLDTPVERPALGELAQVADGISELARALARSERDRDELRAELAQRERLAALGRVVAGVAHEVRNPLASMKLRLDLAVADPALPANFQKEFTRTSEEIDRLDRLVRDLLLVAGQRKDAVEKTDLGALAKKRVELLEPWAKERGIEVTAHGGAVAEVASDAVARAIDNLVKNAVEASPKGSVVDVEVAADAGRAVVRVEDHGPGVDPEREKELFEPFFTTKGDGTGLGLAISRATAGAHGGTLTYARRGDTTRFELSLGKAVA